MITDAEKCGTAGRDALSSYPGGKSGAGIYQRLINLIGPHRVLIVPFAGHCGVVRNIKPAQHTIVIDANSTVCEWWDHWSRTKKGRALEIHNCDGIDWIRYVLGCTKYSAAEACDAGSGDGRSSGGGSHNRRVMAESRDRMTHNSPAEAFLFCDPPYVMSERSGGKIYECELSDDDHARFVSTLTRIDATRYHAMVCGYRSQLYTALDPWESIDHRVPTRRGLQDECIWMNYPKPIHLHDYRYIGNSRRARERIRRRQKNWLEQLKAMPEIEREAMLKHLLAGTLPQS